MRGNDYINRSVVRTHFLIGGERRREKGGEHRKQEERRGRREGVQKSREKKIK